MNKSKQSLRSTFAALAEEFAEAVIAAARESLFEVAAVTAPQTRREPARRGAPAAPAASQLVLTALTGPTSPTPATPPTPRRAAAKTPIQPAAQPVRAKRTRVPRIAAEPGGHGPSDQLITDPQLLLAALETAAPALGYDAPAPRKEPEILRSVSGDTRRQSSAGDTPVTASDHATAFAPVLREGEVIVRRSAGGVVLRRRRG